MHMDMAVFSSELVYNNQYDFILGYDVKVYMQTIKFCILENAERLHNKNVRRTTESCADNSERGPVLADPNCRRLFADDLLS